MNKVPYIEYRKMNTQKAHASGSLSGCVGFFVHRLFLVLQLFMGFLLDDQPSRKAILEMALTFLGLGDRVLCPKLLHQSIVLFAEPLG